MNMNTTAISFGNLWRTSWTALKGNFWKSIAVIFIVGALQSAASCFSFSIGTILLLPLEIGVTIYFLQVVRGSGSRIESIFLPFNKYGHYLWVAIRPNVFALLWALLFVIPGIIAKYRYALTYYVALDEPELSAREAMARSCRMMKGHKMQLFGYTILIALLISVATVFTLGIALFWLLPWCGSFMANYYLAVKAESEAIPEQEAEASADAPVR